MHHIIITTRSLFWILLGTLSIFLMIFAILSPMWLIGVHKLDIKSSKVESTDANYSALGLYRRCDKLPDLVQLLHFSHCTLLDTDAESYWKEKNIPRFWRFAMIFFIIGLVTMTASTFISLTTFCIRSIVRKSAFTILGTVQAIAGLFYLLGLTLYPAGWGADAVGYICGPTNEAFWFGECKIGWALYLAVAATVLTFLCAIFSLEADLSTSTDQVQEKILKGKNFICLF